ncbi:hypothetical protein CP981_32895 [Streptomyces platensis]|uniref:Uncharacterized protein n=1 Tax=Streptomyces platensis TaxID=58346 RepID=A0AAE6NN00_STRPT|nr:hypothetical protein CP981_32895 [Streptomyces platensis]
MPHTGAACRGIAVRRGKRLVGAETVGGAGGRRAVAPFADGRGPRRLPRPPRQPRPPRYPARSPPGGGRPAGRFRRG